MILAIESSCDESAVALFDENKGVLLDLVHSQIALHGGFGGVVPELAAREHLKNIGILLARAKQQASFSSITKIAVTRGPGLAACLVMGTAAAKAISLDLQLPLLGVNHLRAHIFSALMGIHAQCAGEAFRQKLQTLLPHLGLLVSGGNTLLCVINTDLSLKVLASTRDDAAGEALDKGAKLLGLGYPGGPLVEQLATNGDSSAFDFPRGLEGKGSLDFSFSGLKTSLRYTIERLGVEGVKQHLPDLCASYQEAVVGALATKTKRLLAGGNFRSLGISGGVANNATLRTRLEKIAAQAKLPFLCADRRFLGDNAGMVAFAAWLDPQVRELPPARLTISPAEEI